MRSGGQAQVVLFPILGSTYQNGIFQIIAQIRHQNGREESFGELIYLAPLCIDVGNPIITAEAIDVS